MNTKQRESLSKLFYDLVKVPLALCMIGPVLNEPAHLLELEFLGFALVLSCIYFGYQLES